MSGASLYRETGNGRKHGFAETVSRLWYNNQNVVYLNLFVVALFGVLGSLAYDLIAALDQTVSKFAPLGTMLAYIGICMAILFFAMQHGYSMFQLQLSMGRTRKGFFGEQLAVRAVLLLVMQLMAYGLYQLELWKFRTFYPEREAAHLVNDIAVLFTPRVVCLITLLGLAVSMLLIALALRFGVMANIILVGLYLIWVLLLNKAEQVAAYLGARITSENFLPLVTGGLVLTGAAILAGAWAMMRRQEVR